MSKHHGAAEARRAHNPEGTGSKPVGARKKISTIFLSSSFVEEQQQNGIYLFFFPFAFFYFLLELLK